MSIIVSGTAIELINSPSIGGIQYEIASKLEEIVKTRNQKHFLVEWAKYLATMNNLSNSLEVIFVTE